MVTRKKKRMIRHLLLRLTHSHNSRKEGEFIGLFAGILTCGLSCSPQKNHMKYKPNVNFLRGKYTPNQNLMFYILSQHYHCFFFLNNTSIKISPFCVVDREVVIDTAQNIPYDVTLTKVDVKYGVYGMNNFYKMQVSKMQQRFVDLILSGLY